MPGSHLRGFKTQGGSTFARDKQQEGVILSLFFHLCNELNPPWKITKEDTPIDSSSPASSIYTVILLKEHNKDIQPGTDKGKRKTNMTRWLFVAFTDKSGCISYNDKWTDQTSNDFFVPRIQMLVLWGCLLEHSSVGCSFCWAIPSIIQKKKKGGTQSYVKNQQRREEAEGWTGEKCNAV